MSTAGNTWFVCVAIFFCYYKQSYLFLLHWVTIKKKLIIEATLIVIVNLLVVLH